MKMKSIGSKKLTNALHLQFMTEAIALILKFNVIVTKLGNLVEVFQAEVNKEDLSHKIIRKSNLSNMKMEKDDERDNLLVGIHEALKSLLRHFDANIREAANRLKIVVDTYNNPTPMKDLSYDAETAEIKNMLQELEGKYSDDLQLTGMTGWINKLKTSNEEFESLVKSYNVEQSGKPSLKTKDARKNTDIAYNNIVTAINGFVIIEGESNYAQFITEINTLTKHYNDLVAQHLGRLHVNNDKPTEDDSETNE
jgi:hypothetical protein